MDSRARECENPAYFVILAHNCDLGAPTIPQSTEKWCIFVSFVRFVVLFSTILVVYFHSFPLISVDLVVRDLTETSILLAETINACAYVFLLSLSLTQDGLSWLVITKRQEISVDEAETSGATAPKCSLNMPKTHRKGNKSLTSCFGRNGLKICHFFEIHFV